LLVDTDPLYVIVVGCSCCILSAVVVLTPNGQFLGFAIVACSERYVGRHEVSYARS